MYDIMENYTGDFIRYHSGIAKMKALIDKKRLNVWREVHTTILQGEAGSGKSKYVYDKHGYENVFKIDQRLMKTDFWGSYDGESVLLIDDFNGWIQYTYLLQILDGHPIGLNIKNGGTYANWKHVYFTSNCSMSYWYKKIGDNLARRIKSCLEVTKGNTEPLSIDKRLEKDYGSGYDNGYNIDGFEDEFD